MRRSQAIIAALVGLFALVLALGALDAWTFRHQINADAVSYLDIGDAYAHGQLGSAVNAYWSPLYSWVLGSAVALTGSTGEREFALTHAVNLAVFVAALGGFVFFVSELLSCRALRFGSDTPRLLSSGAVWAVASLAFGWGSVRLVTLQPVTPDLLVASLWFTAMGLLLRSARSPSSWRTLVALGVTLGLAYLAKTAMLPIALSFVAIVAIARDMRRSLRRAAVVLVALLVVSLPFVVAISVKSGKPTIGESAALNYAWNVDGVRVYPPFGFRPTHPIETIWSRPAVIAYGSPIKGTFPIWYDPTYWSQGIKPRFDAGRQLRALLASARVYRDILLSRPAVLLVVASLFLLGLGWGRRIGRRPSLSFLRFAAPAVVGLLIYAPVFVEKRYIGAFVSTLTVVSTSVLPRPAGRHKRLAASVLVAALVVVGLEDIARPSLNAFLGHNPNVEAAQASARDDAMAADGLRRIGLGDGARMALLSNDLLQDYSEYLPRLVHARVVATMFAAPARWRINGGLARALRRSGAEVLDRARPASARRGLDKARVEPSIRVSVGPSGNALGYSTTHRSKERQTAPDRC